MYRGNASPMIVQRKLSNVEPTYTISYKAFLKYIVKLPSNILLQSKDNMSKVLQLFVFELK